MISRSMVVMILETASRYLLNSASDSASLTRPTDLSKSAPKASISSEMSRAVCLVTASPRRSVHTRRTAIALQARVDASPERESVTVLRRQIGFATGLATSGGDLLASVARRLVELRGERSRNHDHSNDDDGPDDELRLHQQTDAHHGLDRCRVGVGDGTAVVHVPDLEARPVECWMTPLHDGSPLG